MGIIELGELITKALADGKHVVYDYSEEDSHVYCKGWAHVDSVAIDGNNLGLDLFTCHSGWSINVSDNEIDDFIARVAIYDTLFAPRDAVIGGGKRIINNSSDEYPLTLTEAIGVYKVHSEIVGWKTRYIYETDDGMRFI